ncbi:RS19 [Hepatospora eriocheir]|uniref:RS19 n=1 Tax=Hepatospora eriocheir TaxID=1081669 RepID=A0A1X0QB31_9MICR|nr:RS19 [Hepatospora eriocheir]ORD99796.1 RS19 [Hepatospora eriocheir]
MDIHDKVYRVDTEKLLEQIKNLLKEDSNIELPKNIQFLKSGHGKQYVPDDKDAFFVRMASIVRQAICKKRVSLTGLAYRYGNRKNRGVRPTKFAKASTFLLEAAIKNLEKIGWFDFKQKETILTEKAKKIIEPMLIE